MFMIPYTHSSSFDEIYRSEIIKGSDNNEETGEVNPLLIANIKYQVGYEYVLRVKIIYRSSLTNNKEVTLCETVAQLSEILGHGIGGLGSIPMLASPHLRSQAIVFFRLLPLFPLVLNHLSFLPCGPITSKNPLKQSYVFYHEDHYDQPAVHADEWGFESRLSIKVPFIFLNNLKKVIKKSRTAWLERKVNEMNSKNSILYNNDLNLLLGEYTSYNCDNSITHFEAEREWEFVLGYSARNPLQLPTTNNISKSISSPEINLLDNVSTTDNNVTSSGIKYQYIGRYPTEWYDSQTARLDMVASEVNAAIKRYVEG